MLRLGHRETTAHFAVRERREVFLLLFRRSVSEQDLHVADVRRLAVEHVVAERRASQFLAHASKLGETQTKPSMFFRQVRRPQAASFHFLAHGVECRYQLTKWAMKKIGFKRIDTSAHKLLDSIDQPEKFLIVVVRH